MVQRGIKRTGFLKKLFGRMRVESKDRGVEPPSHAFRVVIIDIFTMSRVQPSVVLRDHNVFVSSNKTF